METSEGSSKVYTRTGDKGKTSLIGGSRVLKSNIRLEAYGTIDELNSLMGLLIHDLQIDLASASNDTNAECDPIAAFLTAIQNDLFNAGSQLACEDPGLRSKLPGLSSERISDLELEMDRYSKNLKPLRNFILPGGCRSASLAHLARTTCRRAERLCVALSEESEGIGETLVIQYLNRLSDYFFVLARHLNRLLGIEEPIWGATQKE